LDIYIWQRAVAPSSVTSENIRDSHLDETYFSPSANSFCMKAHCLAYVKFHAEMQSSSFLNVMKLTHSDLLSAFNGNQSIGYCGKVGLYKEGITALLAAIVSKSFNAYCQILHIDEIVPIP
jgi:hypothetical protein